MQSILDKKLEIKNKMEDYILNFYWLRGEYIRFKDIKKKFHPYCSEGSIANYLQELQDEKRIYKWNKNNIQYYGSPKKHVTTKYFIVFTLLFPVLEEDLWFLLHILLRSRHPERRFLHQTLSGSCSQYR